MQDLGNEQIEISLLLEAMFKKYGFDFRGYSPPTVRRRVLRRMRKSNMQSISEMISRVLHDGDFFEQLALDLSINVTEMFRDPAVFRTIRHKVLPILAELPTIRIWHAGCATGEEAYSMAILLEEAGLADRARIYATDFNDVVLDKARQGIVPLDRLKLYTSNYQRAGGQNSFADYYHASYDDARLDQKLRERILFANHNLVTDGVFADVDLIVCRNVLIYFTRPLQDRVLDLFHESLSEGGVLCIGSKETLSFSSQTRNFKALASSERIFQKHLSNPAIKC